MTGKSLLAALRTLTLKPALMPTKRRLRMRRLCKAECDRPPQLAASDTSDRDLLCRRRGFRGHRLLGGCFLKGVELGLVWDDGRGVG